jgi:hypothetical protein
MKVAARVRLTLLGGFQAQVDGGAALVLPTRKTQALLATRGHLAHRRVLRSEPHP